MAKINIRSFLILERTLTKRLMRTWRPIQARFVSRALKAIKEGDDGKVNELIRDLDLSIALKGNRRFVRFMGMAAFTLGVGRFPGLLSSPFLRKKNPLPIPFLAESTRTLVDIIGDNGAETLRTRLKSAISVISEREAEREDLLFKADVIRSNREILNQVTGRDTQAYLSTVSSLHNSRLSAWGYLQEAQSQNVTTYTISEQIDSDTICPICVTMHGQSFRVEQAVDRLQSLLTVDNFADLKTLAPWPSQSKQGVADFQKLSNDQLVASGFNFPPYHPLCRGLLVETNDTVNLGPLPAQASGLSQNTDFFPLTLDELKHVEDLGGTTGATLMRNASGKHFVVKKGASQLHIQNEFLTNKAYEALGVSVPRSVLLRSKGRAFQVAEFVEGTPLSELSSVELETAIVSLRKRFSVDALLGNWDVIGLELDNILVTKAGKVIRVDNGGALRYRAQGTLKAKGAFDENPIDLWSMRNRVASIPKNTSSGSVFGGGSFDDYMGQIRAWTPVQREEFLRVFNGDLELQRIMAARLTALDDVAGLAKTVRADGFVENYADNFAQHIIGLRKAGVSQEMQDVVLSFSNLEKGVLTDANGVEFDGLRRNPTLPGGEVANSVIMDKLEQYIVKEYGEESWRGLQSYWSAQSSGTDSPRSVAVSHFLRTNKVKGRDRDFYWPDNSPKASVRLFKDFVVQHPNVDDALRVYNTFLHEVLRNMKIPGANKTTGALSIFRTEGLDVVNQYKLVFEKGKQKMIRQAISSVSIGNPVNALGTTEIMQMEVPFHRFWGFWGHSSRRNFHITNLFDDREKEWVADLQNLFFKYSGTLRGSGGPP